MSEQELAAHALTAELAACGNLFHRWQWSLSSSSNYSALLDSSRVIISRSGVDKEKMQPGDFMLVDLKGAPLAPFDGLRPSAETELHCHAYRNAPQIRSVLHTHSKYAVYFSRRYAKKKAVVFSGFEMEKIFEDTPTHEASVAIPIFANSQAMANIVGEFDAYLKTRAWPHAYLIEGHGVYTWGKTVLHAKQKLEALEYLLELKYMEESNAE